MKLLVGGDPEVFLKDKATDKYISADGIIPGTKKKPHPVDGGSVQVDGLALEVNIEPAKTAAEFETNLGKVLDSAKSFVSKDIEFAFIPAVDFDKDYWKTLPRRCLELGCDPDYNGKTGTRNPMPRAVANMRTGAGHITLGWTEDADVTTSQHFYDCKTLAQRLSKYFLYFRYFWDQDQKRCAMYGSNAAFRPKPFGVEYRELSNAWVGDKRLWTWIFDSAQFVFDHAIKEGKYIAGTADLTMYNTKPYYIGNGLGKPLGMTRNGIIKFDPYADDDRLKIMTKYASEAFGGAELPKFPVESMLPALKRKDDDNSEPLYYDMNYHPLHKEDKNRTPWASGTLTWR